MNFNFVFFMLFLFACNQDKTEQSSTIQSLTLATTDSVSTTFTHVKIRYKKFGEFSYQEKTQEKGDNNKFDLSFSPGETYIFSVQYLDKRTSSETIVAESKEGSTNCPPQQITLAKAQNSLKLVACSSNSISIDAKKIVPTKLVIIGDSMAAGILANTKMGSDATTLAGDIVSKIPEFAAAAHDSDRLRLFQKYYGVKELVAYGDEPNGSRPWSHEGLLAQKGIYPTVTNLAIAGAAVSGGAIPLNDQLDALQNMVRAGEKYYVVLNVGGNDFCAGNSIYDFKVNYEKIIAKLAVILRNNETVLLVVPIVNVPRVLQIGRDSNAIAAYVNLGMFGTQAESCSFLHENIPLCSAETGEADINRYSQMNPIIKNIVNSYQSQFPGIILFADEVATLNITENFLAIDCFHPNQVAQEVLATATWKIVEPFLRN